MNNRYKLIFPIVFIMLIGTVNGWSFAFTDAVALIQRTNNWIKKNALWLKYSDEIELIVEKQISENSSIGYAQETMSKDELDAQKPKIEDVVAILNSPFYKDVPDIGAWKDIFEKKGKLEEKLPSLTKTEYKLKNSYLENNPDAREYAEESNEIFKEYLQSLKNITESIQDLREMEKSITERMKNHDKLLEKYATEGVSGIMYANKLQVLGLYLDYDIIMTEIKKSAVIRKLFNNETREKVIGIQADIRLKKYNSKKYQKED